MERGEGERRTEEERKEKNRTEEDGEGTKNGAKERKCWGEEERTWNEIRGKERKEKERKMTEGHERSEEDRAAKQGGNKRKGKERNGHRLNHSQSTPPLCLPSCSLLVGFFTGWTIEGT